MDYCAFVIKVDSLIYSFSPGNSSNSQDENEGSESDSSADSCSSPNYDSAVFQSSLRSFQMSESKRKKLRELEVNSKQFKCLTSWLSPFLNF